METRPGLYRDSVRLMQISSGLTSRPGVSAALVAMATGLNLDMLRDMGFDAPTAAPNDMLVALVTADEATMAQALEALEAELAGTTTSLAADGCGDAIAPRTTLSAIRSVERAAATGVAGPTVVLVSTPGRYAFIEAMDALDAGASVMVFSDNVPVAQEVLLKETANRRGQLVMGPDCGTAIVGGVGLGFANVVRPGPIGLIAASGTGAQQVMSLLAEAGVGISHCLGVGGRDLSAAVGGRSTQTALDALDADPATELIVLIGKPPAPEVAEAVREHMRRLATPVLFAPLGPGQADLTAVAADILRRRDVPVPAWARWQPRTTTSETAVQGSAAAGAGDIRGLFSGGTLCVEAMVIASAALGPVRSNVPLRPEWTMAERAGGHTMLDLGADEYTVGRPHPMVDFGPRLALLATEAADPACRVLLLDVVLGHGAHPDPATELAPAVRSALAQRSAVVRSFAAHSSATQMPELTVVISLVAAPEDPQDPHRQAEALRDAGAWVFASNAEAARYAVDLAGAAGVGRAS